MRGFRQVAFVIGMVFMALVVLMYLTGCSNCEIDKDMSTELREMTAMAPRYSQQSYNYQEIEVVKECYTPEVEEKKLNDDLSKELEIKHDNFLLKLGPVEWVDQPLVEGQTNWIRRQMTVYNGYDDLKVVWLDKIDYYDGEIVSVSKNPMKVLVDGKSSRQVPLMKNKQYDPKINIGADFANRTKMTGETDDFLKNINAAMEKSKEVCTEKEVVVDKVGYRNVTVGTKEVVKGYKEILKVKLSKTC